MELPKNVLSVVVLEETKQGIRSNIQIKKNIVAKIDTANQLLKLGLKLYNELVAEGYVEKENNLMYR